MDRNDLLSSLVPLELRIDGQEKEINQMKRHIERLHGPQISAARATAGRAMTRAKSAQLEITELRKEIRALQERVR